MFLRSTFARASLLPGPVEGSISALVHRAGVHGPITPGSRLHGRQPEAEGVAAEDGWVRALKGRA